MCATYKSFVTRLAIAVLSAVRYSLQEIDTNPAIPEYNNSPYYWQREGPYETTGQGFDVSETQQEYCHQVSTELVDQFQSLPIATGPISCSFTMQVGLGTCGLRIDFLDTQTAASISKVCYQDIIMILRHGDGDSFNAPFCGDLQGYSTIIQVESYDKIEVFVLLQKAGSKWNIRLTQIKCEAVMFEASDACGFRNSPSVQYPAHSSRSQRINSRWLAESHAPFQSLYYRHASASRAVPFAIASPALHRSPRIINGLPSSPNEFPWVVLILLERELHCTGTLINHQWVLTAAHCTSSPTKQSAPMADYSVALGVHNRALIHEPGRVIRDVSNVVRHPQYEGVHYDIALLKLNESVRYSHAVRPICLPNPAESYRAGDVALVAGWGSTSQSPGSGVLLSGPIPFVNASYCRYVWQRLGVHITDSILCAGLTGSTTCEGDSGSPLVREEGGVYRVVGVTSFGASPSCGSTVYPDVFTRVASFVDWIALATHDVQSVTL